MLASEEEPGGPATRQLMLQYIPDKNRLDTEWVTALRHQKQQDPEYETLSQAWGWIEKHARRISLREIVEIALEHLVSRQDPDWSVLIQFGHWAKHRNRADLLTLVLVQSNGNQLAIPIGDALLADPYVEHGPERRRLLSDLAVITGVYVELDPKSGGAHECRTFFEKAGAKGGMEIKALKTTANRRERKTVAAFLGDEINAIPEVNNKGYTLLDFDIEPPLPSPDAARELRTALAPWLEDGFRVLKKKGRRTLLYTYYSRNERAGIELSAWARKLSKLAWVPCNDEGLRLPRDVLAVFDPAREDAPFAKLSPQLLFFLDQEGVRFGTSIPEATSLRKLSASGSVLDAAELAALLFECREQITTDVDGHLFKEVVHDLRLPTSDNRRVSLQRIVQRVGGRLRGPLGGWIVPLDRIEEKLRTELGHADFPCDIPETTTGGQALDYVHHVWRRARMSPEGLANEVRDVLPTAYAYCLDDIRKDASLLKRWQSAVRQAMVFADRGWLDLADKKDIYLNDIDDRRFLPRQGELRIVTGGHLGRSRHDQIRIAEAIGLPVLSSCVTMEWIGGDERLPVPDGWISKFEVIFKLLQRVRGSESIEDGGTQFSVGVRPGPSLVRVSRLSLVVSVGNFPAERVPANAHLHDGALTVAGRPLQFGADAAKELLRDFSFGQRAGVAADLTGMLTAISHDDFVLAADKFRRSHAPAFDFPAAFEFALKR